MANKRMPKFGRVCHFWHITWSNINIFQQYQVNSIGTTKFQSNIYRNMAYMAKTSKHSQNRPYLSSHFLGTVRYILALNFGFGSYFLIFCSCYTSKLLR